MNSKKIKKVVLSPMAGYTDSAFRRMVKVFSSEIITISEMISAEGISRKDKKSLLLGEFHDTERPFYIQIFASEPDALKKAIPILEEKFNPDGIDLNLGCPAKKILKNSSGGFLLKNKNQALKIIEAARKVARVPISVKTRLGFSKDDEILAFSRQIESAGASSLTIHGRRVLDGFSGASRWENIYQVKENLKIPVFGNGDITKLEDVDKIKNLDGVFIGRAALGRPWFLAIFLHHLQGKITNEISFDKILGFVWKHALLATERKDEEKALMQMRGHLSFYFKNFPGASLVRQKIVRIKTLKELKSLLEILGGNFTHLIEK